MPMLLGYPDDVNILSLPSTPPLACSDFLVEFWRSSAGHEGGLWSEHHTGLSRTAAPRPTRVLS